jgi:hypothetical protein
MTSSSVFGQNPLPMHEQDLSSPSSVGFAEQK